VSESKTLKCFRVRVYSAEAGAESETKISDSIHLWHIQSRQIWETPLKPTFQNSNLQRWSDSGFSLSDPILFLKNDIRIRPESCFGWNHTIRIRILSESVLRCVTYIFVLCLFVYCDVYCDAQHTLLCCVYCHTKFFIGHFFGNNG